MASSSLSSGSSSSSQQPCPITWRQSASTGFDTSSSPHNQAFGSSVVAGNYAVVAVAVFAGTGPSFSNTLTDTQGNVYTPVNNFPLGPSSTQIFVYVAKIGAAGPCTVTVTPSGSCRMVVAVHEYPAISDISVLDSWCSAALGVVSGSAGTVPIRRSCDAVFAAVAVVNGTVSAGAGFTQREQRSNPDTILGMVTMDNLAVGSDTNAPFTSPSGNNWVAIAVGFRAVYTPTSQVKAVPGQAATFQYTSPTANTFVTTPLVCTYKNPTSNGDLLTCCVTITGDTVLTTTVTDNKGNNSKWQLVTSEQAVSGNGQRCEIWQCPNANGGTNHQLTITPAAAVYLAATINEYTGSTGLVQLTAINFGTTNQATTGQFATFANGLTLAVMGVNTTPGSTVSYQNSIGIPTGWTTVGVQPPLSAQSMGISVISYGDNIPDPGTPNLSATWDFADNRFWVAAAAGFQAGTPSSSLSSNSQSSLSSAKLSSSSLQPSASSIALSSFSSQPSASIVGSSSSSSLPKSWYCVNIGGANPFFCLFLDAVQIQTLAGQGVPVVGGPYATQNQCMAACGASSSSPSSSASPRPPSSQQPSSSAGPPSSSTQPASSSQVASSRQSSSQQPAASSAASAASSPPAASSSAQQASSSPRATSSSSVSAPSSSLRGLFGVISQHTLYFQNPQHRLNFHKGR